MGLTNKINFYFFALAVAGKGISGGDRIFIEFARRWSEKYPLRLFTSFEGAKLCKKQNLRNRHLKISSINNKTFEEIFFLNYLYKILAGIIVGFRLAINHQSSTIIYSASEFWMDSLPAFILKIRYPKIRWVAAWYQTAPSPLSGYIWSLPYWLVQLPVKPIIKRYSDFIFVNNYDEKKEFNGARGKIIVVLGAVDLEKIENWKRVTGLAVKIGKLPKVYDAVFQGRFHPQKGVVELVDVWKKVVDKKPDAKLAMIGNGPLMQNVKFKIKILKLEKNIKLFGYVFDGPEKYQIFSQSKIVVHPAFYDSGGMAAAEAMAFGLPAVGFDLPAFKSYYPKGMVKVEIGNLEMFAKTILELLRNENWRREFGNEALKMIKLNWSWEKRAKQVLETLIL